jgi:hypothetical protein
VPIMYHVCRAKPETKCTYGFASVPSEKKTFYYIV